MLVSAFLPEDIFVDQWVIMLRGGGLHRRIERAQRQEGRPLGVGDSGQARDIDTLIAAIDAERTQAGASLNVPHPNVPVVAATDHLSPLLAQLTSPDNTGVAVERRH